MFPPRYQLEQISLHFQLVAIFMDGSENQGMSDVMGAIGLSRCVLPASVP